MMTCWVSFFHAGYITCIIDLPQADLERRTIWSMPPVRDPAILDGPQLTMMMK